MIEITTTRIGHKNVYMRTDTDPNGKVILSKKCELRLCKSKHNEQTMYSIITKDGTSSKEAHKFLNMTLINTRNGNNSRRKAAEAIYKFLVFIDLMGYCIFSLGRTEIEALVKFLKGNGENECTNETVNIYLATIRAFFTANEIDCPALFAQRTILKSAEMTNSTISFKFKFNLPTSTHKNERAPKYISPANYTKLVEIAREQSDWTGIMLMHLMYRYGLRLGECLGITEEDLTMTKIKGNDIPTIILRNRLSDRPDQSAKRRLSPQTREEYLSKSYIDQWRNDEFSHIYLTESTQFAISLTKFVNETKERAIKENAHNYSTCEADVVDPKFFYANGNEDRKNHYIFPNRLGKRLSAQLWGQRLKEYFKKADIPIDHGKKDRNLSHRFRHGFAMMHARFMDPPVPPQELKLMMRHKSLASTMIYYNPTIEDEYELKTTMQNKFFDNNPRLNEIIEEFIKTE